MEATALLRTGSGRFPFPSTLPAEHYHHDLPSIPRTRSAAAARSSSSIHLQITRDAHRLDVRGVPLRNTTLRRAASCDSQVPASSSFRDSAPSSAAVLGRSGGSGSGRYASTSGAARSATLGEEVELELSGGGAGRDGRVGGGGGGSHGGGSGDHNTGMGEYYRKMLQADPENPLLLMNYGKFLQEVEGDVQGAEDCFGRAVLASPGDGEALSLYGNLVWEAHRDEQRADDYFQRAVQAAPEDCYVLASYAHFLWDADEEEEENADNSNDNRVGSSSSSSSSLPTATAAGNATMVKAR